MKKRQFCLLLGVLASSAAVISGCHNSAAPPPELSKATFGYPGMPKSAGYYEVMKKMHAAQAKQNGPPAKPQ